MLARVSARCMGDARAHARKPEKKTRSRNSGRTWPRPSRMQLHGDSTRSPFTRRFDRRRGAPGWSRPSPSSGIPIRAGWASCARCRSWRPVEPLALARLAPLFSRPGESEPRALEDNHLSRSTPALGDRAGPAGAARAAARRRRGPARGARRPARPAHRRSPRPSWRPASSSRSRAGSSCACTRCGFRCVRGPQMGLLWRRRRHGARAPADPPGGQPGRARAGARRDRHRQGDGGPGAGPGGHPGGRSRSSRSTWRRSRRPRRWPSCSATSAAPSPAPPSPAAGTSGRPREAPCSSTRWA